MKIIDECTVRNQIWNSKWRFVVNRLVSSDFTIQQNTEVDIDLWMLRGLVKYYIAESTIMKAEIESRIDVIQLKNTDFFK